MIDVLLLSLVMILAGYGFRRVFAPTVAKDLNTLVFYFTLPPLIVHALHGARFSPSMLSLPFIAFGAMGLGGMLAFCFARQQKLSAKKTGSLILMAAFGNTTFFGYPIVQAFYGNHHLTLAVLFDLLGAALVVNTVGILIASLAGGQEADLSSALRRLLTFPPIWALLLGLLLREVPFPQALDTLLVRVGDLTTPLIMLSIGLSLRFESWKEDAPLVLFSAAVRLFLVPLAIWLSLRLLGLPLDIQQAAVLQTAMPTMFFALTLSLLFGLETAMILNGIIFTTFLSFLTLPFWYALLAS